MKVIATKHGKFAPRDGREPFTLKPGDEVPSALAQAALEQGWGRKAPAAKKPARKGDENQDKDA